MDVVTKSNFHLGLDPLTKSHHDASSFFCPGAEDEETRSLAPWNRLEMVRSVWRKSGRVRFFSFVVSKLFQDDFPRPIVGEKKSLTLARSYASPCGYLQVLPMQKGHFKDLCHAHALGSPSQFFFRAYLCAKTGKWTGPRFQMSLDLRGEVLRALARWKTRIIGEINSAMHSRRRGRIESLLHEACEAGFCRLSACKHATQLFSPTPHCCCNFPDDNVSSEYLLVRVHTVRIFSLRRFPDFGGGLCT